MLARLLLAAVLIVAAPAHAQTVGAPSEAAVVLQPGDVLQIRVWREPDLSGDFLVDVNGTVTLPLLGETRVTSYPVGELRDTLLADYARELRNPSIIIIPLRRVYVLGDVNAPGLKTLDPTVTLAGAIALAGGTNPQGDLKRIQIVRDGQIVQTSVSAASVLAGIDVRSGDQIIVGRRSWFDRNSTFVVSALLSVTSIIITLAQ